MSILKEKLREKIVAERPRTEKLMKEFGNVKVDEVTIGQVIGGMRDIKSLVTDISYLDPFEGIRFRGLTIPEVFAKIPKVPNAEMPSVEGFFYFLLTGDIPTETEVAEVRSEFDKRREVPSYVFNILKSMPIDSHPMTMFATGIMSMQKDSIFAKDYHKGLKKANYWEAYY
ncbi:MAG: citrate (Si)-synthase, partial [Bacteroidetes bacterium]|nr:citrate (Si)-synthase [Bacteroidota bacterium]